MGSGTRLWSLAVLRAQLPCLLHIILSSYVDFPASFLLCKMEIIVVLLLWRIIELI